MNSRTPGQPAVIFVEDNERLRDELVHYLVEDGFMTRGVGSGDELNRALEDHPADILILDLNMAGEDGISITRRIRRTLPEVGIIILTGRVRGSERLEGYASGADVYLTKPTRPDELVAVIRNLYARLAPAAQHTQAPQWQLDVAALSLRGPQGVNIALTATEMRLLKELSLSGQYLDREALAYKMARPIAGDDVNIVVLISRLRRKLRPHIDGAPSITCHRKQGYQLCLPLTLVNLIPGPAPLD